MKPILIRANAAALEQELNWLYRLIDLRFKHHFEHECPQGNVRELDPPELTEEDSFYATLVRHYDLDWSERLLLILCLTPHIRPQVLDVFSTENSRFGRPFTEFGGVRRDANAPFLPTVETALFLLAGEDLEQRFQYHHLFESDHYLQQHGIIQLDRPGERVAFGQSRLVLSPDILTLMTTGEARKPDHGLGFPARRVESALDWDDIVLSPHTKEQLQEIHAWMRHARTLLDDWQLGGKVKPGHRSLFCGPPGTGKTLTASLLGRAAERDVYRIDLSLVVSKYIGETEKNLERIFSQAEHKDWILFFDEADALFGKRTKVNDAHDRFANQEVSYLLQRVEDFSGLVILATNLRSNLDDSFTRRFHSIIPFPMPTRDERLQLWRKGFSPISNLGDDVDLSDIAGKYEMAGGAIMNVIRFCSLMAIDAGTKTIMRRDLEQGIKKEFEKEGRSV